jgi:putative ABC transport system permease protein
MTTTPAPLSRLRWSDLLPLSLTGLRSRRLRTALSGLGIAIGIAALVSVLGITRSSQADLLAQIDSLGTNLLTMANGQDSQGQEVELPAHAAANVSRLAGVQAVSATAAISNIGVYRTDLVPAYETGALSVRATDGALLRALNGTIHAGTFLNAATSHFPATVLGYQVAQSLGIADLSHPTRIWLTGHWFTVVGILDPMPLAQEIDRSALVGFGVAEQLFGFDGHASRIYVRADTARVEQVGPLLAPTADPETPQEVQVTRPSDALAARVAVACSGTALYLGLGAVALLVGGIGIANVMVIAVLERRTEIGLRRALGATRAHVGLEFLTEALVLSALGGTAGVVLGSVITVAFAHARHWTALIPAVAVWGGLGTAVVLGAAAGVYPALRAARLSPTDALRSA